MRPVLRPGLRLLRRSATSLQIGIDPGRALLVDDCPQLHAVLAAMDGVRREAEVIEAAVAAGVDRRDAVHAMAALRDCAVVEDADELLGGDRAAERGPRPDFGSLSLLAANPGRTHGGGLAALRTSRRQAKIAIFGLAGVGATAARLLAAAGIGRLVLDDVARGDAVAEELRQAAPWTSVERFSTDADVDVVLLAPRGTGFACEPDRDQAAQLMRSGLPHCVAAVRETTAVLGPFVVPGRTPCLRCLDLARAEADPAWPALLSQLVTWTRAADTAEPAADRSLTTLLGAWASVELLAFVQGLPLGTAGATLEVALTDPAPRRREWAAHPACGCGWHRAATMGA